MALIIDGMPQETICYAFNGDNVLLVKRIKPGKIMHECYSPAGGGLELEDGVDEHKYTRCAARELREETGLKTLEIKAIGEILFDNSERDFGKGRGKEPNHKVYLFEITRYSGTPVESEEGKPIWVKWGEMKDLKMMPGDRVFHEWVKEARKTDRYFVGQVKHVDDKVDEAGTWVNYMKW